MAFRHSYSWAGLALACGCCLLAPQAGAGDKIEFSSPAIFWGVPQPEAEQKDNKTEPLSVHLLPYQSKVLYPVVGQSSVNISRRRGADKHTWDSSLSPDSERKDLSGFDRLSPLDGPERATNNWGRPNGRNPGFSGGLEPRNNGDPTEPANGAASQDEASKAFGRDENRNEGLFGDRFTDSRGGLPWMRDSDSHGSMALDRLQHGEFVPFSEDFKSSYGPQPGSSSAGGWRAGMDALHSSSLPPGMSEYSSPASSLPVGREGELFGTPGMAPAWDGGASSRPAPRYNPSAEQGWSAGGQQQQAPPAVLPFPRKPGDLFQ